MAPGRADNAQAMELLFTVDAESGIITDVVGDVETGLGAGPDLLVGTPLFQSVHGDDLDGAVAAFERTKTSGRATWEARLRRADGSFVESGWEGRLGVDGSTVYARSSDTPRPERTVADLRIYERLADLTTDMFVVVDARGRVVQANRAAIEAHGHHADDFIGTPLIELVPEAGHEVLQSIPGRMARGEHLIDFRVPVFDNRGGQMILEGTATFDDVTDRWYLVERDVTDRVARDHELEVAERFFDLSATMLLLIDDDDRVQRANPACLDAVGSSLSEVVGRTVDHVLGVEPPVVLTSILHSVRSGMSDERHQIDARLCGTACTLDVHAAPAREGGSVFLSCRDITEERSLQNELLVRATTDGLTAAANRATLLDALDSDLASGRSTAFVMLDLDGFKRVNDGLGHATGDALLQQIASRLDSCTRSVDIVARFGGDEFAVLLRGVPDAPTALIVAEKLCSSFRQPFDVLGRPVSITASVGTTAGRGTTHTAQQILLEADVATYAAKESGGDRARVFDDRLRASTDFAHALEDHLRRVLTAEEFELDVVPVCDLEGTLVGVGVTAPAIAISGERRWNAPTMAMAKKLGLLGPLSLRMTDESVSGLAPWLARHPDVHLDIVFDVIEIEVAGFADDLLAVLDRHGMAGNQLIVSLVGVTAGGIEAVDLDAVHQLRQAGVRVSFAASRADTTTLAALRRGCIDRIDVDTPRVALAPEGSIDRLIASTVFDVADRMGVEIVADASFAPDVVDTVTMFPHCAPVGLVYGRPVPIDEFVARHVVDASPDPEVVDP